MRRLALSLCLAPALIAQEGSLSLDSLYHPTKKVAYTGAPMTRLQWASDGTLVEAKVEKGAVSLLRVDPRSWEKTPLLDADKLRGALVAAGAKEESAKAALSRGQFTWREDCGALLLDIEEDLYLVELKTASAKRLTQGPGSKDEPTFSPDGSKVAFLRDNDLYVVDIASAKETRLSTGGDETHFNGRLDWVYQEEVYGRGDYKAFWWSPDSKRLAYLSLDETKVPVHTLPDDRGFQQKLDRARYPQAGDPNPIARLGLVDLDGKTTWTADPYAGQETLIVQVGWTPAGRLIAAFQDRVQTWLDLRAFDGTSSTSLIREESKAWQERLPLPLWLPDGGFIWESDRSGFHHLYRYDKGAKLVAALTKGSWDVKSVHGFDPKSKQVFFDATERSPIGEDAYAAAVDGKLTRLTERAGTHRVRFNKDFSLFLDSCSDIRTPAQQSLCDAAGKQLRLIDANELRPEYKALKLGEVRFVTVKTRDGFPMEAAMVLPVDFDPHKKYPVYQHIYGGPAAPQVHNAFNREMLWFQFLAQHGILTWVCDNRSASAKGNAAFPVWKHMGALELQDQLDGLKWLGEQGYADLSRVCLEGWSYGGFMASYSLTHSTAYKLGLVGAPVTDWHLYDSIYTERYMGLPKDNKEGYESSSVLKAADKLAGKLLIMHGALDDNVHPTNTIMLIDALTKAGQDYELRLYPGSDHGSAFGKPWQQYNIYKARWDFIEKNL